MSGVSEGRFIRLPGGKKTPVYTDTGGKLGAVESFAVDPLDGRIALVMIVSRRFGVFATKRLALPWTALSVEPDTGRLVVRTEDGLKQGLGARSAPALRRDPSRVEPT
ncbi:MAG: PRC-barrel domain-containing protein [Rhodospirillales bacterium]|nr:PRC-barrel domain-containing protein [Rhodospirillales bacterium]